IENVVGAAVCGQYSIGAGRRLMPAAGLLATRAITEGAQDRRASDLELDLAAAAGRRGVLIRHCAAAILERADDSTAQRPACCKVSGRIGVTRHHRPPPPSAARSTTSGICRRAS